MSIQSRVNIDRYTEAKPQYTIRSLSVAKCLLINITYNSTQCSLGGLTVARVLTTGQVWHKGLYKDGNILCKVAMVNMTYKLMYAMGTKRWFVFWFSVHSWGFDVMRNLLKMLFGLLYASVNCRRQVQFVQLFSHPSPSSNFHCHILIHHQNWFQTIIGPVVLEITSSVSTKFVQIQTDQICVTYFF